ncbi:peptide deformylase [Candidatus Aerophobetes bacterium]|uniref:Peptide deformylase n=1 Tax=Aerophobetes bacterium TaxID=2030807 RepID=A0A662D0B5_UNCAE|nr:MAG: peptide deformylase [Candidatus Aerophobetes bacterium]
MSSLRLRRYGDPILRRKAKWVERISSEERGLLSSMAKIMYENEGIGLAAPQIGVDKRIIIVDTGKGLLKLINPQVIEEEGEDSLSEGCLSLPEIFVPVNRAKKIRIEGLNEDKKLVKLRIEGFLARVIQHEVDHLNGVLIIDYATEKRMRRIKDNLERIANHTKMVLEIENKGR